MTNFAAQLARAQQMAQQHGSLIYVPSPQCECICHRIQPPPADWGLSHVSASEQVERDIRSMTEWTEAYYRRRSEVFRGLVSVPTMEAEL